MNYNPSEVMFYEPYYVAFLLVAVVVGILIFIIINFIKRGKNESTRVI